MTSGRTETEFYPLILFLILAILNSDFKDFILNCGGIEHSKWTYICVTAVLLAIVTAAVKYDNVHNGTETTWLYLTQPDFHSTFYWACEILTSYQN